MVITRNSDPNYYEDTPSLSNCGSYAFGITGWFRPYRSEWERRRLILTMYEEGHSAREIEETLLKSDVSFMKEIFGGALSTYTNLDAIPNSKRVIAYRLCVDLDDFNGDYYTDFHFKVRENGKWMHKQGITKPEECELDPDKDWGLLEDDDETIFHYYDSPIIYLVLDEKI